MTGTIFALSSGLPPAAIAVIRISGPAASKCLQALAGKLPEPRRATLRNLRDSGEEVLDHALVLWLPGPATVTGEDMAELHCHGGRAVIAAVEAWLARFPELRRATAGEFTRRAFANGRIDLAEAEGLADLLTAETELQRRSAQAMAGGALSTTVEGWRGRLLSAAANIEAILDFADEDDVTPPPLGITREIASLASDIEQWLKRPRAERLRDGFRVVLAGPPNTGKSSLFNALLEDDAAIVTAIAGTTRDVLERPVAIDGVPFVLIDTAGLRESTADAVEAIGVDRAREAAATADLILWLGEEGEGPPGSWEIESKCDQAERTVKARPSHRVSAISSEGLAKLREDLVSTARTSLPKPGEAALNARQHGLLSDARAALLGATEVASEDPLIAAEYLRRARVSFDMLTGRSGVEDMLDTLFGRFCIGK